MYQIITRTGRTVHTGIESLNEAIFELRMLELDTKRANIYSPGYYRIEKDERSLYGRTERKNSH